jgi:drug/metabolite transporter (DMT)-like permease
MAGMALTSLHPRPLTGSLWLAMGMLDVFCEAGTLSFYVAVKHTSASNVSHYHHAQLATGALISYLVSHDRLGLPMLAGGSLIIGSGLLIALAAGKAQPGLRTGVASR